MENKAPFFGIVDIQKRLPHRFPFLLIDRVEEFHHGPDESKRKGRVIVATKNVTINEPFFNGHFPGNPIMPGVLQIEAMAQAGALACAPEITGSLQVLVAKIDNARFKRPVIPGDILRIRAEITLEKGEILGLECTTTSFGQMVSEVKLMAKVMIG